MPPKRNVRPDFVEENYKNGSIHKFPKIYSSGRRVKRGDAPEQVFSHRKCETLFYEYTSVTPCKIFGANWTTSDIFQLTQALLKVFIVMPTILLETLEDKNQTSKDVDTARDMLQLLLGKNWPLYSLFQQFLQQPKYKVINKDQWCNIFQFSRIIQPDLSNYNEDGVISVTTFTVQLN
ncbi:uncharacterized protein LOC143247866 isoform X1 [Tachypleus tridentatus]|uniref:uncharacterized protein LOC143247866 isoform X1 n=1 Tax=Tachypleus tridentatus TaxID=6853 RepID=UPI003FD24903